MTPTLGFCDVPFQNKPYHRRGTRSATAPRHQARQLLPVHTGPRTGRPCAPTLGAAPRAQTPLLPPQRRTATATVLFSPPSPPSRPMFLSCESPVCGAGTAVSLQAATRLVAAGRRRRRRWRRPAAGVAPGTATPPRRWQRAGQSHCPRPGDGRPLAAASSPNGGTQATCSAGGG